MANSLFSTGQGPPGESVEVKNEGSTLTTAAKVIDFVGAAVDATEPVADEITVTITGSGGAPQAFVFGAKDFQSPVNADWAVNALAPAAVDSNNGSLLVRRFDDTTEEGVGFLVHVPSGSTNLVIDIVSRAETGSAANVVPRLYVRDIPDNAVVGSWSAGTDLTAIAVTSNEAFQYDSQTITLATLGATAGDHTQFELTRNTGAGGDTLSGDWSLLTVEISFT